MSSAGVFLVAERLCDANNAQGMASGGMGDVLSGIISALVRQSDDIFYATCLAAYIHAAAADIIANNNGQRGLLASDLFVALQQLLNGKIPNPSQ